jgi:hypothetical protein
MSNRYAVDYIARHEMSGLLPAAPREAEGTLICIKPVFAWAGDNEANA